MKQEHGGELFCKLGITGDCFLMKPQIFALMALLFMASCNTRQNAYLPDGDSNGLRTHGEIRGQEALAKEIVSIQHDFGDAMLHLDNTNATNFVAKVGVLADRLEKISEELDRAGSFPASLREATLKKLDDDEKAFAQLWKSTVRNDLLQPEVAKITDPAVDRFFSVSGSVMMKAGLLIEAK
ncbi:MAG: hypothetical protein BWX84_02546 [Verrucomicrobia bacterium ADurb.Bin118]|jgi:hypothetical protein|nr:MAG: hypothetical protein BWX84_02546 [Verrucomicrobia bacterium ADurb.Bin118]